MKKIVSVGSKKMGGNHPILIQTMLKIPIKEVKACICQMETLFKEGCDLLRLSVQTQKEVFFFEKIKNILVQKNINLPLIADIHYVPKLAVSVIDFADKVRINPGNFLSNEKNIEENFLPLLEKCKKYNKPIRIGVNFGSLSKNILERYKKTAYAMVFSLLEYVDLCEKENFHEIVLSLKASRIDVLLDSHEILIKKMQKRRYRYPIHVGVTEAGEGIEGRVKSALGIGLLLQKNIPNTIRVSLTEDPLNEIKFAKELLKNTCKKSFSKREFCKKKPFKKYPIVLTSKKSSKKLDGVVEKDRIKILENSQDIPIQPISIHSFNNEKIKEVDFLKISILEDLEKLHFLLKKYKRKIPVIGIYFSKDNIVKTILYLYDLFSQKQIDGILFDKDEDLILSLLQEMGLRDFKVKYISCPGCGRTKYNLQKIVKSIKEKTRDQKGVKIAIMGCRVNGPGEMEDADFGIIGAGEKKIDIYVKKTRVKKSVDMEEGKEILLKMITAHQEDQKKRGRKTVLKDLCKQHLQILSKI